MTDRHGGAHNEFLGYRCDSGQDEQTFNVRIIRSLHVVGRKYQVVSHPHRVKTVILGFDRAFEAFFHRCVLAKVW